jgi:hypothetical protein
MAAQPAPRPERPLPRRAPTERGPAERPPAERSAARLELRRRRRHLQQLRRDLLVDVLAAIALMIFVLVVTAGLGVVALLELPVGAVVVGSYVVGRRRAK